ncbi:hypothetical protein LOTGIDRAFT_170663 [Lottia gigantea]|uniref:Uncharacterized protein n=1 Tax=Lottia gigantea TaxID=225164 RepID=V4B301_LOTGI|nr:hypothetical protein LOTGIDRAFT_170663 [Lottia gigantea]ESP04568.1 hypothetical protein LOTGIDRAFT_170663 [Lottia gigantea]
MVNSSEHYNINDKVEFNFNISLITTNVSYLSIDIHGDSLKFENSISEVNISLTLIGTDALLNFCYSLRSMKKIHEDLLWWSTIYSIQIPDLPSDTWILNGTVFASVSESAGPGALIRGIIDLTCQIGNETFYDQLISDYAYKLPLVIRSEVFNNGSLQLRAPMTNQIIMLFDEGEVAPKVTAITPFDESSEEAAVPLKNFAAGATHGIDESGLAAINESVVRMWSTAASYQSDIGQISIPAVSRDTAGNETDSGIVVQITSRLEDFSNIANVSELGIGLGVYFGQSMIWITTETAAISVSAPQRPELNLEMKQGCTTASEESFDVTMSIIASHSLDSTATAFNVTLFLYAMESMSHVAYSDASAKGYQTDWNVSGNVRSYYIERITFSTPMDILVREMINMKNVTMKRAKNFIVMAEVVYTDRWANDVEYWSGLKYLSLDLPLRCARELNWTLSVNCTCSYNTSLTSCGCCQEGACQCGEINPNLCLPCDQKALCQPRLPEFTRISELVEDNGSRIVCDAFFKYRPIRKEASCYRMFDDNRKNQAFPATVATILGVDYVTGYLYGISNNGLAYVRSHDKGASWVTIEPTFYDYVQSAYHYIKAVFSD